jgi:hypothetical protein
MKPIITACLLILFAPPSSFGATDCKIVEYSDRNEITCIGDEMAKPEQFVPATPSQSKTVETLVQSQAPPRTRTQEPVPPAVTSQKTPEPSATTSQQASAAAATTNKASENLVKRRDLATRNSRNLTSYTSATALSK